MVICKAISHPPLVNYTVLTDIQKGCIPHALSGRDIGIAPTGSGKTAAFALPILQNLWDELQPYFACVLALTYELAFHISEQFEALGSAMGARSVRKQAITLAKQPNIIVATPGTLNDRLKSTKGFSLHGLKYLLTVLNMDFSPTINDILKAIPKERTTCLFSATMTTKVSKLQRASLTNPARVEYYVLVPLIHKDVLLVYLINSLIHDAQRLNMMLHTLGFSAVPLHGQLSQSQHLGALAKIKSGSRSILVATDVASHGLDIPSVNIVINFDVPMHLKDYIHCIGQMARARLSGKSITMITQYDVEFVEHLEDVLGKTLVLWLTNKEEMLLLHELVDEVGRLGQKQKRKHHGDVRGDDGDRDDDVVEVGMWVR
ncbi:P-loop containing nucleoside triphosphate hydrolase protein [Ramaria rubella]|nr:P-loop containing nucleoside triphosphate hydrolase protein [Ramaria rubella]